MFSIRVQHPYECFFTPLPCEGGNVFKWNPDKGCADGRSENAITVNRAINELTKEISEHYNNIKKNFGFVTAELVKNAVKGIGQKTVTLLALFREHNEEFKKRIGIDRIKETYLCYQRSYGYLETFVREKRGVEDVTLLSILLKMKQVIYGIFILIPLYLLMHIYKPTSLLITRLIISMMIWL